MNFFKEWEFGYTAKSPDGKYELWIANGFLFFYDYESGFPPKKPLLLGVSIIERYKLWRQLKKEMKRRFLKAIECSSASN